MDEQKKMPTLAIFEFEWKLTNNIPQKTGTILSKMVEFRGENIFRAGLKNQDEVAQSSTKASSTLLFMATDLAKLGLKAETVLYSDMQRGIAMTKMELVVKEAADNLNGKVQLFTAQLGSSVTGNKSYKFRVYITGVVEHYQFNQKDSLINEQLWLSSENQVETDFKILVGKKIFPVHKFILAARSPVFASLLNQTKLESNKELKFDFDVDESCMKQFLKFVYTGELHGAINNPKKLKELATTYQIKTLESICEAALKEMDEDQMVKFLLKFKSLVGSSSIEIMQDTESIVQESCDEAVLNYEWKWNKNKWDNQSLMESTEAFEYKKEKLFRAQLETTTIFKPHHCYEVWKLNLLGHRRQHCGCIIQHVACSTVSGGLSSDWKWKPIEEKSREKLLQMFCSEQTSYSDHGRPPTFTFHVQVLNLIPNYDFKIGDSTWEEQIWSAAIAKKFTDVEFLIGDQSFAAHRFILSARSPVFAAMFKSGMAEDRTGQVRIDDDVDVNIFRAFLEFLYVGALKSFDGKEELYALADKYQVETLMALCKPTNELPMDIDDFTKALLAY